MELQQLVVQWLGPWASDTLVQVLITLVVAAAMVATARWTAANLRAAARWLRVARGCHSVPAAPGGGLLGLGHVVQLATAPCSWEKMLEWARVTGPLTRFHILNRTGLIVNDPEGAKRVFQVRGCDAGQGRERSVCFVSMQHTHAGTQLAPA